MMIGHHQAVGAHKGRGAARDAYGGLAYMVEPRLVRREVVRRTPVLERRRVERPHRPELLDEFWLGRRRARGARWCASPGLGTRADLSGERGKGQQQAEAEAQ